MKYIPTIVLGFITLFFGVYAMVLELKGISPLDQLLWCMLFGLMTYWSRNFPLPEKLLRLLKGVKQEPLLEKILDYFEVKETVDGKTLLLGDFADKKFCHWLQFIHGGIQKAMNEKLIDGSKIDNYMAITFIIGGQRVEIAIIKDGKKGPHELLQEIKGKNE